MDIKATKANGEDGARFFYLIESRAGPSNDDKRFRQELKDNEPFETDFIGASLQDCQIWALEQQRQHNFIEQDIIVIVDARSVRDGTVLASHFHPKMDEPLEFGRYGQLPREGDTWYDYRIDYQRVKDVSAALGFGPIDAVYPLYFGLKEELTDERGVFGVAKAERIIMGEEDRAVLKY